MIACASHRRVTTSNHLGNGSADADRRAKSSRRIFLDQLPFELGDHSKQAANRESVSQLAALIARTSRTSGPNF